MRYSKRFLIKTICLAILISLLVSVGVSPDYKQNISYGYDTNDKDGYTEYIVKKGDNLSSIAKKFNTDISTLIKDNRIKDKNHIYVGQKLKIRDNNAGSKDSLDLDTDNDKEINIDTTHFDEDFDTHDGYGYADLISLDMRDADLRDVISTIAYYLDSYAILLEEPVRVNFQVKDMEPHKALGLLLQTLGLSYIQDGELLVIGQLSKLQNEFYSQMMLTRFNLKYISSDNLESQIQKLGIPIQIVTIDKNPKAIWVQGPPQSLTKVKEIINMLDKAENATESSKLVSVKLKNITTDKQLR